MDGEHEVGSTVIQFPKYYRCRIKFEKITFSPDTFYPTFSHAD